MKRGSDLTIDILSQRKHHVTTDEVEQVLFTNDKNQKMGTTQSLSKN